MSFFTLEEIKKISNKIDCYAYLNKKKQFVDAHLLYKSELPPIQEQIEKIEELEKKTEEEDGKP